MKQVLQWLNDGAIEIVDVPTPQVHPGYVLVRSEASVISAGTERMLLEFGKASLLGKARQQPERIKQAVDKARTDGLSSTIGAVRSKLAQPITPGYANAGRVVQVGAGVTDLEAGERVVSNGPHAEFVCVPRNLCVAIPASANITSEAAAFAVLGAIALQGLRLAKPTLGETFAVTGLGILGLLTVQLLRANGCRVLAFDTKTERLELAERFGAKAVAVRDDADPVQAAYQATQGHGVDGVLLTLSTPSSQPVAQAAKMCRKRGRIVLVGVTGLELNRADFYEKELSFQVSCSYGPGRYDPAYEQRGHDYPFGYVRWTERRNIEAVLDAMATGALDPTLLISDRINIESGHLAYERLRTDEALGIVLRYPEAGQTAGDLLEQDTVHISPTTQVNRAQAVSIIGAGNYAQRTLLPILRDSGAHILSIVSRSGTTAAVAARAVGAETATTNVESVLNDERVGSVFIATRHDSHAMLAVRALRAGKNVFVEKPLALTPGDLDLVWNEYDAQAKSGRPPLLCVGFNRRFSPYSVALRHALSNLATPKQIVITVNAGALPDSAWPRDAAEGGGRLVGEACHFIDLLRFLVASPITDVSATRLRAGGIGSLDNASITLTFGDGSVGAVHYFDNGHPSFPKERVEVFAGGRAYVLDNFRKLKVFGAHNPLRRVLSTRQDKGHVALVNTFLKAARGDAAPPIPLEEIFEVSRAVLRVTQPASASLDH